MLNISFAWTTPAVRAGRKTCTRRKWKPRHVDKFHAGREFYGLNADARYGGKAFGIFRVAVDPYEESTSLMPDSDYEAEGFAFLDEHPELKHKRFEGFTMKRVFHVWRGRDETLTVVRFEPIEIFEPLQYPIDNTIAIF